MVLSTALRLNVAAVMVLLTQSHGVAGAVITLDFEGFSDSTPLTTQYAGLTFSNATVITAGITLNELEFPPYSGSNVAFDDGGPIVINFASPTLSFAGYFTYADPLTLAGFDVSSTQVGTAVSAFSSNLALSGDLGSSPNEFLSVSFASGISSVTITGDSAGGSFVLDDATYTTPEATVPEPSLFPLLLLGAVACAVKIKLFIRSLFYMTRMKRLILAIAALLVLGFGGGWLFATMQQHEDPSSMICPPPGLSDNNVASNDHTSTKPSCQPIGYPLNELLLYFTPTTTRTSTSLFQFATQVAIDNGGKLLDCVPEAGACDLWVPSYTPEALDAIIAKVNSSRQIQDAGGKATRYYLGGGF